MLLKKTGLILVLTSMLMLTFSLSAYAQTKTISANDQCLTCHGIAGFTIPYNGKTVSLNVDKKAYQSSVHGNFDCVVCHLDFKAAPHPKVDFRDFQIKANKYCLNCHPKIEESYNESFHGKAVNLGSAKAATCSDCHTSHNILGPNNTNSTVNKDNIAKQCARCHGGNAYKNFANGTEHYLLKKDGPGTSNIMYYTVKFFSWLLFVVISLLFIHMMMELYRNFKNAGK